MKSHPPELGPVPRIASELDLLASLVPLDGVCLIELGCGDAKFARDLLSAHPATELVALEVDARQHAANLATPRERLHFLHAPALAVPRPAASFDGALMLKSLHHVPRAEMPAVLAEVARLLRPGGWLYVSEPVAAGPLNEITRLYHDEEVVRSHAQQALDEAVRGGAWVQQAEHRFALRSCWVDFADFERRAMRPVWADRQFDAVMLERVRARFEAHLGPDGAVFDRPMHMRLLRLARTLRET